MKESTTAEPLQLGHFQDRFFREAIRRHVEEYDAHFGERLAAIYVSGSVHRNEALPGLSDLDLHPFIIDTFDEADWQWKRRVEKELEREFGIACGLGPARTVTAGFLRGIQADSAENYTLVVDPGDRTLRWQPVEEERVAKPAREYGILLRYDATLVSGCDLTGGLPIAPPDGRWARVWFLSPWELTRFAAGLARENRTDFDLPEEPRPRLHELAKLAKLGGVALLMARGAFRSFRYTEVFPALKPLFPRWSAFLDESSQCYLPPSDPTPDQVSAYLSGLVAWMEWIGAQLYGDPAVQED
jgi:hypothetical protein